MISRHIYRAKPVSLIPETCVCSECGGGLSTLGEDVCEYLELERVRFKVIRQVRPKVACTRCDVIAQEPAPSRPIERGMVGPGLLAHVLVGKYADHQPLHRLERYIYDDSNGAENIAAPGRLFQHGGLYAIQRWTGAIDGNSWQPEQEMSYDELGRLTLRASRGSCGTVTYLAGPLFCGALNSFEHNAYDSTTGRLQSATLPSGVGETFAYDPIGHLTAKQFNDNGTTPAESYTYDPDGRVSSASSSLITGTQYYTYDADGNLSSSSEPSSNDAHILTYSYYPNDARSSLTVSGPVLNTGSLMSYNYRSDGLLSHLAVGYGANQSLWCTYTNAGRLSFRYDLGNRPATGVRFLQTVYPRGSTTSKVIQYDALGRVSAYGLPQGAYTNFGYTQDGQVASYTGYIVNVTSTYGLHCQLTGVAYTNSSGATQTQFPNFSTIDQGGFDDPSPDTQWNFANSQIINSAGLYPTWDNGAHLLSLTGKNASGATAISETNQNDGLNRLTNENIVN